jgi:hypothetical protein
MTEYTCRMVDGMRCNKASPSHPWPNKMQARIEYQPRAGLATADQLILLDLPADDDWRGYQSFCCIEIAYSTSRWLRANYPEWHVRVTLLTATARQRARQLFGQAICPTRRSARQGTTESTP